MEVLQHCSTSIFYINNRVQISLYYAYILGQLKIVPFRTGLPALLSLFKMSKNALSSKGYAVFSSVKLRRT